MRNHPSWLDFDVAVDWLLGHLGDEFREAVRSTQSALHGPLSDSERRRLTRRTPELKRALAALSRRDRTEPIPQLPSQERRAVLLAMNAYACHRFRVDGLEERIAMLRTADDIKYRSTQFELECAHLLLMADAGEIVFVPESDPGRKCEFRIGGLIDVECKRLSGLSVKDRATAERWHQLRQRLQSLGVPGFGYLFQIELQESPTDGDIEALVDIVSEKLANERFESATSRGDRVSYRIRRKPLVIDASGLEARGLLPDEPLENFHVGALDVRATVEAGQVTDGLGFTFAFRTVEVPDVEKSACGALKSARGQLAKDRPSIVFIDAYEPLNDLGADDREPARRRIYRALQDELGRHSRPTGLFLAAPEPESRADLRTYVYTGNPRPATPFPDDFQLGTWAPARSETLSQS